jgi:hypothetical protein
MVMVYFLKLSNAVLADMLMLLVLVFNQERSYLHPTRFWILNDDFVQFAL